MADETAPDLSELVPVGSTAIGGATIRTIRARDVHAYLQVGKDLSTWIKDRIAKFGFVEGVDYVTYEDLSSPNLGSAKSRAQVTVEYALTLDMGKELGMVDRSDRGREIRRYFLACERRSLAQPAALNLSDPVVLLRLLTEQAQGRIADQRRAVEAEAAKQVVQSRLDLLEGSDGSMCLRDAAKILGFPKCDDIFHELHARRWIYKRDGKGSWIGHQDKIRVGYLEHEDRSYKNSAGEDCVRSQVLVTARGMVKLAEVFAVEPQLRGAA